MRPKSMATIRELNPEVSIQVEQAIMHAIAMHPDDRPASVADFRAELMGKRPIQLPKGREITDWLADTAAPLRAGNISLSVWRETLWQNRLLLAILAVLLALAIGVTALPAKRSFPVHESDLGTGTNTGRIFENDRHLDYWL